MSIRHSVSIHCDDCGNWEWGDSSTSEGRKKRGWIMWRDDHAHAIHYCPKCAPKHEHERPKR